MRLITTIGLLHWKLSITLIVILLIGFDQSTGNGAAFNITRVFNHGDVFNTLMDDSKCDPKNCAVYRAVSLRSSPCYCQCPVTKPAFLQHLKHCDDSLDGCKMVEFVTSHNQAQTKKSRIPTVFLPLKGSIVNPNAVLDWQGIGVNVTPDGSIACTIAAVGYIYKDGLTTVENAATLFALTPNNGNTYLQWTGSKQDQMQLSGKVIQVSLQCEPNTNNPDVCVVFRIVGKDVPMSAVALASVNHDDSNSERSNQLGLIVGIVCGVLLAVTLICVAIFWTVCWRQQKERLARKIQLHVMYQQRLQQQNGGVFQHFGQAFNPMHEAAVRSAIEMLQSYSVNSAASNFNPFVEPHCWAQAEIQRQGYRHPSGHEATDSRAHDQLPPPPPYPHVVKKRLHFSPEFFDPELMVNPPPVAEEFLFELRRMIDVAKGRIRSRRYLPSLDEIPEEDGSRHVASLKTSSVVVPTHNIEMAFQQLNLAARHVQTTNLEFLVEEAESPRSSSGGESQDSVATADRSSETSKTSSKDSGFSGSCDEDGNKVAHWLSRLPACIEIDETTQPLTSSSSSNRVPTVVLQHQRYLNEPPSVPPPPPPPLGVQFQDETSCIDGSGGGESSPFCHVTPVRKASLNENLLTQHHIIDPLLLANHLLRSYSIPNDPNWWLPHRQQQMPNANLITNNNNYGQKFSGTLPKTLSPGDLLFGQNFNNIQHNDLCKHLPYGQSLPRFKQLVRPPLASDLFLSNSSSQTVVPADNNNAQLLFNNAHNV